jgi:hypothetical protein
MIQARYGWPDDLVSGLTLNRFNDIMAVITEAEKRRVKERFTVAAFVGWQLGAGGKIKFADYLRKFDLMDKPKPLEKTEKRRIAKRAYERAALIVKYDKLRKGGPACG